MPNWPARTATTPPATPLLAGIDHRVERAAARLVEADRVEGIAAGFHANLRQHVFRAPLVEGQAIHERLGDRLDREPLPRITDFVDEAVGVGDLRAGMASVRT
jgi:hypothetical protein